MIPERLCGFGLVRRRLAGDGIAADVASDDPPVVHINNRDSIIFILNGREAAGCVVVCELVGAGISYGYCLPNEHNPTQATA